MTRSKNVFRLCCKSLLYLTVSLLVLLAISLSLARVLLPSIEDYKVDIETWVSELVGQQIEIGTLGAAWYGFEPQLVLKGVRLLSEDRMQTYGYFQQARLGIDLVSSVLEGRIRPGAFTLAGARFVVVRQKDGSLSLEGFTNPADANLSEKNRLLDEWFFKQRLLEVKDSEIVFVDLMHNEKSWVFSEVNLRFRNHGLRHWVDGWVNLPSSLGGRLNLALDARGDLFSADAWSGNAYLESKKLNIAELSQYVSLDTLSIDEGEAGIRLWSQWRKAKLYSVQGAMKLNHVQVKTRHAPKIRVISQLSTNFSALKDRTDWEITFDKVLIESGRRVWPETRLDIKYNPFFDRMVSEVTYLDLRDALPVASLFSRNKNLSQAISGLKATGVMTNLNVTVHSSDTGYQFLAKGSFSNLEIRSWRHLPGVSALDGQFSVSNRAASLFIPTQNITLNYPQQFLKPHEIKNFKASLFSRFDDANIHVVSKNIKFRSRAIDAFGSFSFAKNSTQKALLDLAFYFDGGQLNDAKYLVPAKKMPATTVDWLGDSLLGGELSQGSLLFFGELGDYPFKTAEGLLDLTLEVKNGTLKFAPDWPVISAIDGVFELDSQSFSFLASSGLTLDTRLKKVYVALPDYLTKNKQLIITGKASGKTQNKLTYFFSTPLASDFANDMKPLLLEGESELELDLKIPLAFPKKTIYFGELVLNNNKVIAKEWKLDVNKVFANLRFNNDGLWSNNLQGETRGVSIQGSVKTIKDDEYDQIVIQTSSLIADEKLTDLLDFFIDKSHWGTYFTGRAEIETAIIFPLTRGSQPIQLVLNSEMSGVDVDLPYPLRKTVQETKPFQLLADLTGSHRRLAINYGDTQAIFEMFSTSTTQQILRGGIGFREAAKLPEEIGYRFSGKLKEFAWAEWGPLLIPDENKKALFEGGGSSGSIYFDINVDEFALFGNKFGATSIQASHTSQLWSMHLSGNELEGNIVVPIVLSSAPMVVNMTRLHVNSDGERKKPVDIDPREMPEIKLKVADFKYNDISFGTLEINAKKTADGLRLDRFNIKNPKTTISAQGDWLMTDKGQRSRFDIKIDSQDVGNALQTWGYEGAIGGGTGTVALDVNWPGKPSDFDFKVASGDVMIDVKNTSMLGFELGAARMFGLLLPRRLLLDFRDVFKKGMHFDEIKGKYTIQSGDAFTSGLYLKGPVADIHIAGRIGLSQRDYDQVVTVDRRIIGDSVPVLAALTVAPLLAAQVFIFKKMFEKQINDILSIQYTIVGSWENPAITPVIKNAVTGEDLTEDIFDE